MSEAINPTYEDMQEKAKGPGASEMAFTTRWEVDHGLRWDKERQVWVARDGFAYALPEERTTREAHAS